MRVAIITMSSYPFHTRGAEIGVYYLSRELAHRDFQVTLYLSEFVPPGRPVEQPTLPPGMRIVQSPGVPLRFLYNLSFVIVTLFNLSRARDKPKLVAVNLPTMLSLSTAFLARLLLQTPYLVIIHGPYDLERKRGPIRWLQCTFIARASEIVCVSRKLAQLVSSACILDAKQIHIIPNGYDPTEIENSTRRALGAVRTQELAFIGALIAEKDPVTLVRSFKIVNDRRPGVLLNIIGKGPLEEELHRYVADEKLQRSVLFHEFMPHAQFLDLLARSTLLAVPSRREGMPTVIIEALALGVPVVATATDGLAEIICPGENGYLVPVGAVDELASRILEIVNDPNLRVRLSKGAKRTAIEYAWNHIAERYASLFARVASSDADQP